MHIRNIGLRALITVAGLSAICVTTPASAIPITDLVDPTDTLIDLGVTPSPCPLGFTCTSSTLSFLHDLTDDGFDVGLDTITSATIVIHLTDAKVTEENNETYSGEVGTEPQSFDCLHGNCVPNTGATVTIPLDTASLADLAADGMITVTIGSTDGSFSFADSLLTAEVTEYTPLNGFPPAPINGVPEPATLLLLGAGLVGLGLRFRRRS